MARRHDLLARNRLRSTGIHHEPVRGGPALHQLGAVHRQRASAGILRAAPGQPGARGVPTSARKASPSGCGVPSTAPSKRSGGTRNKDASKFAQLCEMWYDFWHVAAPYLMDHPTRPRAKTVAELGWRAVRKRRNLAPVARMLMASPHQLIETMFESEEVKSLLAIYASGSEAPLREPGSGSGARRDHATHRVGHQTPDRRHGRVHRRTGRMPAPPRWRGPHRRGGRRDPGPRRAGGRRAAGQW